MPQANSKALFWRRATQDFSLLAFGRSFPLSALLLSLFERTGVAAVSGSKHEVES